MLYTEILRLNSSATAIPNRVYEAIDPSGQLRQWRGTTNKRLVLLPSSSSINRITPSQGVQSVTASSSEVTVDNTDPVNPVIDFNGVNTDGVTITGSGVTGDPLIATAAGGFITSILDSSRVDLGVTLGVLTADVISRSITFTRELQTINTDRILGRDTIGVGSVEELTVGTGLAISGGALNCTVAGTVTNIATTGPISGGPITTTGTITTSMATNKLIGRGSAGTGVMEEITLGTNLSLSGTTLNVPTGAGGVTSVSGTAPIVSSGGTTPAISLPVATSLANGYLSNTDWSTFNSKQATISVTTPITLTGASVGMVNQGTTTTVLHGNAAGNPSFGAIVNADITNGTIDLTTKVTGSLPIANGGTAGTTSATARANLLTMWTLTLGSASQSPADATTYYFGVPYDISAGTSTQQRQIKLPFAGILRGATISILCNAGSAETFTAYIRVNNTTDITISSALTASVTGTQAFTITGLSTSLSVGDLIEGKFITPTWVTNPTVFRIYLILFIE